MSNFSKKNVKVLNMVEGKSPELSGTREAYGKTLVDLGRKNKDIVVLDADLSASTKTGMFAKEFPERFFNMGVAEQDMISTAAGLALGGKLPFASTFAIFLTGRAWEQIKQSICIPNLNVKLVASHGGVTVGEDGASHHCNEDFALTRVLPNMTVICPADAIETEKIIREIVNYKGPVYVRLARAKFPIIFDNNYVFQIGHANIVKDGKDLTIICIGIGVYHSLMAAEKLDSQGISARVINMATIKPIDKEVILKAAKETGAILTVEEHSIIGGLGSAVAEIVSQSKPVIMKFLAVPDEFTLSGSSDDLLDYVGLSTDNIFQAAKDLLSKKS
jgi:transketolase